ncbi:MAG: GntR family transcriptional regulator [Ruminococcaceae bacterium]|nr:GntR family transcriptional regulator [Oscillospiraceae bacterium]
MITIDYKSRLPVYEQIKNQIMTLIQLGILKADEQLPSIRSLSAETGVNVNTVKRAVQDLEEMGIIYSVPGKGSFVSEDAFANTRIKEKAIEEIRHAITSAIPKGITKEDISELVEKIFTEVK